MSIGGDEMFRDAIRRFSFHLDEADVDAEVLEEPGMFHVFPILMPWSDAGRRTVAAAGEFVRRRLPTADGVRGPGDAGGSPATGAGGGPASAGVA